MIKKDYEILRRLGSEVASIAAHPVQEEKRDLWKMLNSLKPVRPMVMIDQIPWHEMNVDDELTLLTEDPFCREIEERLRRTIYQWKHMRVDMVVEPFIEFEKQISGVDLGLKPVERTLAEDPRNDIVSHSYVDQFRSEKDLEKIKPPEVFLDREKTSQIEARANEIFDGILEVKMQGALPWFAMWDRIVEWRGAENCITDLIERPEFIHMLMQRVTDSCLAMLESLEEQGLLGYGQSLIHCTGAHSCELPAEGFDPAFPRAKDLWTCGMAQIFSSVSPRMHKEFELDYAVRWYERFGLVYYGCCEPLHNKIDLLREIPNLRKISMSPWADIERGAEQIGRDFVFSRKPNPALLVTNSWNDKIIRQELRDTIEKCARYGCPLELILKDISTVKYEPQRLWKWADIAMDLVGA